MTVADDLALREGVKRRYFLKIAGLPYVLNQRVADPTGDDTPLNNGTRAEVDADCVALYRLDETEASSIPQDSSGNGYHMSIQGGAPGATTTTGGYSMPVVEGRFARCRNLYSNQAAIGPRYMQVDATVGTRFEAQKVTLAGWIYLASYLDAGVWCYYGKQSAGYAGDKWTYVIQQYYTGGVRYWRHGIYLAVGAAPQRWNYLLTAITSLGWHHVGLTYDNTVGGVGELKSYADGLLTGTWANDAGQANLYFNPSNDVSNFMVGSFDLQSPDRADDVVVYDAVKPLSWFEGVYADGHVGLNCLRVPGQEVSTALDLGTMKVEASSMSFELDDIEDPADG